MPLLFALKDILFESTENLSVSSVVSYYSSIFHRTFNSTAERFFYFEILAGYFQIVNFNNKLKQYRFYQ